MAFIESLTQHFASSGDTISLAEHHLYGSSRLGVQRYDSTSLANILNLPEAEAANQRSTLRNRQPWYSYPFADLIDSTKRDPYAPGLTGNAYLAKWTTSRTLGRKYYEMTDHLGNVLATVLDRKTGYKASPSATLYDHWSADIASSADYYPGGMMMPNRNTEYDWSRMGYNGQAKTDEVYGKGNLNTALFWEMDTRLIRRWNNDPKPNPSISYYAAFNGNPIIFSDPLGDTTSFYTNNSSKPVIVLNDNNPNAVNIIDDANASNVIALASMYSMAQVNTWEQEKINAVSEGLQQFGTTYDLQSFSDFEANNQGAKATGAKDVSFQGASEFKLDGQPFTPTGEVIGNLVMKNGQVKAGLADKSSTNMTGCNSTNLDKPQNKEPNQLRPKIHTHPGGSKLGIVDYKKGLHFDRLYLTPGVSAADRSGHPVGEKVRSVIVEGDKIHLYNNKREQTITVDRPAPSKNSKKKS